MTEDQLSTTTTGGQYNGLFEEIVDRLIDKHGMNVMWGPPCIDHMYRALKSFDPTRGSKARGYFSVVGKGWFIYETKKRKKLQQACETAD